MEFNKYIIGAVVLVLAIALGFVFGLYLKKPQVISNPIPVYIKGKDSLITKNFYYFIKDTSKAEVKNDTAKTERYLEKVFDKDTVKVRTNIKYSLSDSVFTVNQSVDLIHSDNLRVDTIKINIPVETVIEKDLPFYEKPYFNFLLGIIISLIIYFASGG